MKQLLGMMFATLAFATVATGQVPTLFETTDTDNAQVRPAAKNVRAQLVEQRATVQQDREVAKQAFQETRAEAMKKHEELQMKQQEMLTATKEERNTIKIDADARREEIKMRMDSATTPEEKKAIQDDAKTAREDMKAQLDAQREERKIKAQAFIAERSALVSNRFTAMTTHAEQIISRIQINIDSLQNKGIDMTEAQALIDGVTTDIQTIMNAVDGAVADLQAAASAETSGESRSLIAKAKEQLQSAKDLSQTMFGDIRQAVSSIKSAIADTRAESSDPDASTDETADTAVEE